MFLHSLGSRVFWDTSAGALSIAARLLLVTGRRYLCRQASLLSPAPHLPLPAHMPSCANKMAEPGKPYHTCSWTFDLRCHNGLCIGLLQHMAVFTIKWESYTTELIHFKVCWIGKYYFYKYWWGKKDKEAEEESTCPRGWSHGLVLH